MSAPDQAADESAAAAGTPSENEDVRMTVDRPGDRAVVVAASRCGSVIELRVGTESVRLSPARAGALFARMAALTDGCTRIAPELRGARTAESPPYPAELRGLMRLYEPQRWVECADRLRHAIPSDIVFAVGDLVPTFCGLQSTVDEPDTRHQGLHKECSGCNEVACELLGYPLPESTPRGEEGSR